MQKKVYVTGIGAISAIGENVQENLQALFDSKAGVGPISLLPTAYKGEIPVAEIGKTDHELAEKAGVKENEDTRTTMLGLIAAREALGPEKDLPEKNIRTGLISGNTVGGMGKTEQYYDQYLQGEGPIGLFNAHDCGESTQRIAKELGVNGPATTLNTACSSSANAIMLGARMIRHGHLDRVIAGGVDSLTRFTLNGFNTLYILDRDHCKPFDKNREGLNLGEGAGYVVLESEEAMKRNNSDPIATLPGYSNVNDAYHATASSPDGDGAYRAMKGAIESAGIELNEVSYVNAHGTGTPNNDHSEGVAIERLFGKEVPPYSSTKAFTGHTLGAAGGIEAVYSILALQEDVIFPSLNFHERMDELNSDPVTETKEGVGNRTVLSNSFGFGGNNTSLLFSKI